MYKSILVPLDGSTFGEYALPIAKSIARRAGAALQLVHVHVPTPAQYIDGAVIFDEALEAKNKEQERAYLDNVVDRLGTSAEVPVTTLLLDEPGSVVDSLNNQVKATGAGLVVMSTHGRGTLTRFWLGSVADEFVRRAEKPILLIRPPETAETSPDLSQEPAFQHILIPLDGSVRSEQMLEHAVTLGKLTQADYTLLSVILPVIPPSSPRTDYTMTIERQLLKQQQDEAQTYLDGIAERLRLRSFQVQTRIVTHRHPATAILEDAKAHGIDLIAMETHGYGGLKRLFIGSVADKVLRGSPVPLLLHRPYEG